MKRKINLLLLASTFMIFSGFQKADRSKENTYPIIPLPNELVPQEGRFNLTDKVVVLTENCSEEVKTIATNFILQVKKTSNISLQTIQSNKAKQPTIRFIQQKRFPKEGYQLTVSTDGITLVASEANGFFYGVQTIYQLLPPQIYGKEMVTQADWSVPGVKIKDAPHFKYRGLMLDVCRHFSSVDYIYKFIDMLAAHKMNTFHWHLTDDQGWRIEIKKYPKLTEIGAKRKESLTDYYYTNWPQVFDGKEHGGYYTQEQIKSVVAYAASKYITVIPEIEMPGHAMAAIASYPELSCTPDIKYDVACTWGVFEQVYCPKEETFGFLEDVLNEVMQLFPSKYIHIGGDECPKTAWEKSKECQSLIAKLSLKDDTTPNAVDGRKHTKEEKLQSYFITRMEKYLNSKGRNIIGWDEILEGGLAPNATVMSWRGTEGGINAAKAGHDAIMTPGAYVYLDHYQESPEIAPTTIGGYNTLKKTYYYNPVPNDADEVVKQHIIGIQGNIWTEYMQNDSRRDYQAFPRAIAIAETGWTKPEHKNWTSFCKRMITDFSRMDIMNVKACRNFFDVNIDTHVYNDTLKVALETFYPNAEIRYTTDGSTPTKNSKLYHNPFSLKGNINLKAASYKNGELLGKISERAIYGNLISGKHYTTIPDAGWTRGDIFGENNTLGEDKTTLGLTNGKRGNIASYTPWVAFPLNDKCNNEVVFTVDLGEVKVVSKVVFGTLYNPAFRVLPAGAAKVEFSTNGKEYKEIINTSFTREYPERGRKMFTDILSFTPAKSQFIRITLQSGGTIRNGIDCRKDNPTATILPSDLYIDEIEVY